jgi:hypothetical protein
VSERAAPFSFIVQTSIAATTAHHTYRPSLYHTLALLTPETEPRRRAGSCEVRRARIHGSPGATGSEGRRCCWRWQVHCRRLPPLPLAAPARADPSTPRTSRTRAAARRRQLGWHCTQRLRQAPLHCCCWRALSSQRRCKSGTHTCAERGTRRRRSVGLVSSHGGHGSAMSMHNDAVPGRAIPFCACKTCRITIKQQ